MSSTPPVWFLSGIALSQACKQIGLFKKKKPNTLHGGMGEGMVGWGHTFLKKPWNSLEFLGNF